MLLPKRPRFWRCRHGQQPCPGIVKFQRIASIILGQPAELINFFINALHPMVGVWMVGKKLWRVLSLALLLKFFKKLHHGPGIVTRIIENLRAHYVSLRLSSARIF